MRTPARKKLRRLARTARSELRGRQGEMASADVDCTAVRLRETQQQGHRRGCYSSWAWRGAAESVRWHEGRGEARVERERGMDARRGDVVAAGWWSRRESVRRLASLRQPRAPLQGVQASRAPWRQGAPRSTHPASQLAGLLHRRLCGPSAVTSQAPARGTWQGGAARACKRRASRGAAVQARRTAARCRAWRDAAGAQMRGRRASRAGSKRAQRSGEGCHLLHAAPSLLLHAVASSASI